MINFLRLLIKNSNLRNKPLDFHTLRTETLKGIEQYLPYSYSQVPTRKWILMNPVLFNIFATAAQIKNSFKERPGHLSATEQKLFYVRIPKAASTSIASEMLGLSTPELKSKSLTPAQLNFLTDAWLQSELNAVKNHIGFTVVRNPLERLVSVYHDIFESGSEKPFIYQNYLGGILVKDISFEEFVSRISRVPDRLKDQHFKPQHLFIQPYKKQGINIMVFKLEEPGSIQEFLSTFNLNLNHINRGMKYDHRQYYSENTLNAALKMYIHDFELFGYEQKL